MDIPAMDSPAMDNLAMDIPAMDNPATDTATREVPIEIGAVQESQLRHQSRQIPFQTSIQAVNVSFKSIKFFTVF